MTTRIKRNLDDVPRALSTTTPTPDTDTRHRHPTPDTRHAHKVTTHNNTRCRHSTPYQQQLQLRVECELPPPPRQWQQSCCGPGRQRSLPLPLQTPGTLTARRSLPLAPPPAWDRMHSTRTLVPRTKEVCELAGEEAGGPLTVFTPSHPRTLTHPHLSTAVRKACSCSAIWSRAVSARSA